MRSATSNKSVVQQSGGISNTPRTRTLRGEEGNNRAPPQLRLLQRRVDTLTIAFQVKCRARWLVSFIENVKKNGGSDALYKDGISLEIKSAKKYGRASFKNVDVRGIFDESASHSWNVEITINAIYLATHSLENAISLARRTADIFGTLIRERVRRFDLCADFANWTFEIDEGAAWIGVGKRSVQTHRENGKLTGYSICLGNPLGLRVYDKLVELQKQGQEAKRNTEFSIYKENGWQGEPIGRIEFQICRECLDQFKLRDPNKLINKIDAIWAYCTRKWIRLVVLGTASDTKRCEIDSRWESIRSVVFDRIAEPAVRIRERNGVGIGQVIGATMSYLGSQGKLSSSEEKESIYDSNTDVKDAASNELVRLIDNDLSHLKNTMVTELTERYGAKGALDRLKLKRQATIARFSSSDCEDAHD